MKTTFLENVMNVLAVFEVNLKLMMAQMIGKDICQMETKKINN
jgi:hypothetical protein